MDIIDIVEGLDEEAIRKKFIEFLKTFKEHDYLGDIMMRLERGKLSIVVEFPHLALYDPKIAKILLDKPTEVIEIMNNALREVTKELYKDIPEKTLQLLKVRITNLGFNIKLREVLKSRYNWNLIQFRGIIAKIYEPKQYIYRAIFLCEKCGRIFSQKLDVFYKKPGMCPYPDCDNTKTFTLLEKNSVFDDYQMLTIQELPEELSPGKMPVSINVIVTGDLVGEFRPGDRVVVVGIAIPRSFRKLMDGKEQSYTKIVYALNIEYLDKTQTEINLTETDIEQIRALAKNENLEDLIISSIAPSIYGLEHIKKAIAAQLFGGVPKILPDGTKRRGDIHILLIGDPGTAKSQILKYVAQIAPRAIYTTGKGSTAAGLTAAAVKTDQGWALEAGALVLADKGIACIDEFDKMREEDRKVLHEVMEQQTISVAKAGIIATLNARASILAAANPKFGRYYPNRGIGENIDLPPTILSRFDLIFVLTDQINENEDRQKARWVLGIQSGVKKPRGLIPSDLLRKYIVYARQLTPQISESAMKMLEDFYVEMRKTAARYAEEYIEMHPVPVTMRQLEALVRLAEAHARMLLKEVVDEEDAKFAIELMKESLREIAYDIETGAIDITAVYTGETIARRSRYITVLETIKKLYKENPDGVQIEQIISECEKKGISQEFVREVIIKEKLRGTLFEKQPGKIVPLQE